MTKTEIKELLIDLLKGEVDIDYALHKLNKDYLLSNGAKLIVSGSLPLVDDTINSLGECVEGNEYRIFPIAGQWWIEHKHVGSGEPLRQFLGGNDR